MRSYENEPLVVVPIAKLSVSYSETLHLEIWYDAQRLDYFLVYDNTTLLLQAHFDNTRKHIYIIS